MELSEFERKVLNGVSRQLVSAPLETERLLLRPFRPTDLEDLYEYLSQAEQRRLSGNSRVDTMEDAGKVLSFFTDPSHPPYSFAIERKGEEKVIGNLSIGVYPFLHADPKMNTRRGVSLSYVLHEGYWRHGYMTELLRELYPRLFQSCGLEYINSGYFDFNVASGALQRKMGMQPWFEHLFERDGVQYRTKEMILWRSAPGDSGSPSDAT